MMPVMSITLRYVGYDSERRQLKVELRHGGVKRYSDVPPDVFIKLVTGISPGLFYRDAVARRYALVKSHWLRPFAAGAMMTILFTTSVHLFVS